MTKSVHRLFADATALIEDMHGISVEGQAQGLSPDMALLFVRDLRSGLKRLDRTIMHIALVSEARQ